MSTITDDLVLAEVPASAKPHTARYVVQGATAMSVLGASTAVSARLTDYPVLGGQALRYTLAGAVFAAIVHRRNRRTAQIAAADGLDAPAANLAAKAASRRSLPGASLAAADRLALPGASLAATDRLGGPGPRPTARDWLLLVLLSATGLVLFNVFVLASLRHTDAATLGSVVACSPLVLAIAGPMVTRSGSRLRPGVALGSAGLVVAGSAIVQGFGRGTALGIVFALLVLACESLFSLLAVPLLPKLGELRVSAYVTAIAVPVLFLAGLATDGTAMLRMPSLAEAAALLYLALPLTVGAFLLWYRALNGLGPQRAGLLIGTVPVAACAASAALGVGTPGIAQLAGVAVVVVGIVTGLARS